MSVTVGRACRALLACFRCLSPVVKHDTKYRIGVSLYGDQHCLNQTDYAERGEDQRLAAVKARGEGAVDSVSSDRISCGGCDVFARFAALCPRLSFV